MSWYARQDRLHLNERAYRELDKIVIPTLSNVSLSPEPFGRAAYPVERVELPESPRDQ
jgi:hypothetical protein